MVFADLVRGAGFRGPADAWTLEASRRLARAIGTVLRRRGAVDGAVVVGRDGLGKDATLRNGLASGLVMSGFDVVDIDVVESDRFTTTIRQGPIDGRRAWHPIGGVYVTRSKDAFSIMIFVANLGDSEAGSRPLVGPDLALIARVADEGGFATVDGGSLRRLPSALLPWPAVTPTAGAADWAESTDVNPLDEAG